MIFIKTNLPMKPGQPFQQEGNAFSVGTNSRLGKCGHEPLEISCGEKFAKFGGDGTSIERKSNCEMVVKKVYVL